MKLGLITDIHEQVEFLQLALGRFHTEKVEQIVTLGDVFELGARTDEICDLRAEEHVIGVVRNQHMRLRFEPDDRILQKYPATVLNYMASLKPRLDFGGCHFTHVEPWLDPGNVADLWYYEGPPDTATKLHRIFAATTSRIMFAGHFHRWLLATCEGISDWRGDTPMQLDEPERYFVVVGALCEGRYATFDTESSLLTPFNEA